VTNNKGNCSNMAIVSRLFVEECFYKFPISLQVRPLLKEILFLHSVFELHPKLLNHLHPIILALVVSTSRQIEIEIENVLSVETNF
jgi:predicted RecB family endonuclease